MATGEQLTETDRTRLRRKRERSSFDRAVVHAVLDEALVGHVGVSTRLGGRSCCR
ncbi:MAG: hypothetical protein JWO77_2218 [Ilumatobacteraceae bacterium]|nr:hypothetical protein [Ilumatobacteraceae bacterium]